MKKHRIYLLVLFFLCKQLCGQSSSSDILPRLFRPKGNGLTTGANRFPWGIYITPEDTILRYFKLPADDALVRVTLQLSTEYHFLKTPSLSDAKKPFSPGQRFLIRDQLNAIYLASWLSACNKLTLSNQPPCNTTPDEDYLAGLAHSLLEVEGTYDVTQFEAWPTLVGRYSPNTTLILGLSIPIRNIRRTLSGNLTGGRLFNGFPANPGQENSMTAFFSDFNGIRDFIGRAVLEPKGIELDPRKNLLFIPKISVDSLIQIRSETIPLVLLLGLRVAVPVVRDHKKWSLDSFIPEDLYSTRITLFGNWIVHATEQFFPYVIASFLHQLPYRSVSPLQQIKDQNSCILIPKRFAECPIQPFQRIDAVIPELADRQFFSHTAARNGFGCGAGFLYFPTGRETVSVLSDYRLTYEGSTITTPRHKHPESIILPSDHAPVLTQLARLGITLIGDNYFTLFAIQMNVSSLSTQMRLAFSFGTAL